MQIYPLARILEERDLCYRSASSAQAIGFAARRPKE